VPVTVHERILDEAPAYLLGELNAAARAGVQAHLRRCAACRAEVARLGEALDALGALAPETDPPQRLRAAVLAAARREPPARARGRRDPRTPGAPGGRLGWAVAAVAAAAALAFAVQASAEGARARGTLAAYRQLLADNTVLRSELAAAAGQPQVSVLALAPTSPQDSAVASLAVVRGPQGGQVVLVARGLPPPRGSEVYQLWYLNGGPPVSAGALTVADGSGRLQAPLPAGAEVAAAAISLEPHPGDVQPLGPIVLKSI
jgi:anti-sigma-K factor RskA